MNSRLRWTEHRVFLVNRGVLLAQLMGCEQKPILFHTLTQGYLKHYFIYQLILFIILSPKSPHSFLTTADCLEPIRQLCEGEKTKGLFIHIVSIGQAIVKINLCLVKTLNYCFLEKNDVYGVVTVKRSKKQDYEPVKDGIHPP